MTTADSGCILYLVPVPLSDGLFCTCNLGFLSEIKIFFSEKISETQKFLKKNKLLSSFTDCEFHEIKNISSSDAEKLAALIKPAAALFSDAGCPCIADPGNLIVRAAHKKNIRIVPLPGSSSIMLALMASGLNGQQFIFHGYFPVKEDQRRQKIRNAEKDAQRSKRTQIVMETPYRNSVLLESLLAVLNDATLLCIASDLTGMNERIVTLAVRDWKKRKIIPEKVPTLFLFGE
ncbi:MAG TPA: SAM-dependent methyltransferase [Spirochaetia bacterium]|nr:SAM-dependent methyltransferase [Spirochaetia bacterium]